MVASIEAPFTFLQKPVKILLLDTVKFSHMTLCLIPKILNPINVVLFVCKKFTMIDASMVKVTNIKCVVRSEGICVNNAIRLDFFTNNGE